MATLFFYFLLGVTILRAMTARSRVVLVTVRRVAARTVAVLAIVVILDGAQAYATCGDYLAHPIKAPANRTAKDGHAADSSVASDVNASPTKAATAPKRSPSRPCDGPFCGQLPSTPVAPAPAPAPTVNDHTFALLVFATTDVGVDGRVARFLTDDAYPLSSFGRRVDRPPRA